jgi:hypothetical protein
MLFVQYIVNKKWGQFNLEHYGFVESVLTVGVDAGILFGYICRGGIFHDFNFNASVETHNATALSHEFTPYVEYASYNDNGVVRFTSVANISGVDEDNLLQSNADHGNYLDPEGTETKLGSTDRQLDSYVRVGLLRYTEGEYIDNLGLLTAFSLGAGEFPVGQISIDWNVLEGEEDWLTFDDERDWGADIPSGSNFSVDIRGTNDSFTTYEEALAVEPYEIAGKQNFYPAEIAGIYFDVTVKTVEVGDNYHVKIIELEGNTLGTL